MNETKKTLVESLTISDQADIKGLQAGLKKAMNTFEEVGPADLTRKQQEELNAGLKTWQHLQQQIEAEKKAIKAGKKIKVRKVDWAALIRLRRAEAIVRGQE
jgi:hypothetical protein